MRPSSIKLSLLLAALAPATALHAQRIDLDADPIRYSATPARDRVALLKERIERGEVELAYDSKHGYLPAVLDALGVQRSSQGLVFLKLSLQRNRVSTKTPRAIYFADDVYVAWVKGGGLLEIAAVDPRLGGVFYTIDQRPRGRPRLARSDSCLQCHRTAQTADVPGHFVRSTRSDPEGNPIHFGAPSFVIDATSPIERRWAGWYVSGTHGAQRHLGNVTAPDLESPNAYDVERGANVTDLSTLLDTSQYLVPHSDVVALMVLEHQIQAHNAITKAGYEARIAIEGGQPDPNQIEGEPLADLRTRLERAVEPLLDAMLFCNEAKLTAPIRGTSGFAEDFAKRGPRDHRDRSLRDFDLERRLFRYPLSYLIYSEAFDGLPRPLWDRFFERLGRILKGDEAGERWAHLSAEDRSAILEILLETRQGLPKGWRPEGRKAAF